MARTKKTKQCRKENSQNKCIHVFIYLLRQMKNNDIHLHILEITIILNIETFNLKTRAKAAVFNTSIYKHQYTGISINHPINHNNHLQHHNKHT